MLAPLLAVARRAGKAIMEIYATDFEVTDKADDSPLTAADLAAHHIIVEGLQALTPDIPILSEESSRVPYATRRRWDTYWLVDPLDGTKEFIKRNGEFTVNIALVQNGSPVVGVVHVPATDVSYAGCEGVGAFRQDGANEPRPIRAASGHRPPRVVASRSHRSPALDEFLDNLGEHEIISIGSSLKFCLVAEGRADLYPRLGPTSEWDTAAGHCVAASAGAQVFTVSGEPLRYNAKETLLNPYFIVVADPAFDWLAYLPAALQKRDQD